MKKKEKTTIMHMKPSELDKAIAENEQKLAQWAVNRYSKQSKNVREGRALKRKLAVLKTEKRRQEITHE